MRRLCGALLLALGLAGPATAETGKVALEIRPETAAAVRGSTVRVEVTAVVAPGWHINAHEPNREFLRPTVLTVSAGPAVPVETVRYPPPEKRSFAFAGGAELLVYAGRVSMGTAVRVPADFAAQRLPVEAVLQYQACDDTTCLRPATVSAAVEVPVASAGEAAAGVAGGAPQPGFGGVEQADRVSRWLSERGLPVTLVIVALLGLGLNLTPCVYPLISVTIAYFGRQGGGRGRAFELAALYVLGIALSFSAGGVAAAFSGELFGAALQRPVVLLFLTGLMVVLALASFGMFHLRPPALLVRWVGGPAMGAAGALFMGLTMGIVAAPCVGPVVIGLLIFVGSRQDAWLGFMLFFVLAAGMGLPYLVLAAAAGSLRHLPRSGEWMLWGERFFGCLLLSLAAYYAAPLLPAAVRPWLVPVVLGLSAVYLGLIEGSGRRARGFAFVKLGAAIGLLAAAAWIAPPLGAGQSIAWQSYGDWARNDGAERGSAPLVIDFAADWCIPCREMEHATFVDPEVVRESARFRMVKADLTPEDEATKELLARYDVQGVPTVLFFSPGGEEVRRLTGYVDAGEMLDAMRSVERPSP